MSLLPVTLKGEPFTLQAIASQQDQPVTSPGRRESHYIFEEIYKSPQYLNPSMIDTR